MKKLTLDIKDLVNRLDISTRKIFTSQLAGNYQTIFKGEGLEFFGYRKYLSTDDAAKIDWKASARSNELMIREYVEERSLNVFFLIDVSASMLFGSKDKLKAQYAAEFVASLGYVVVRSSDSMGFGLFTDKVVKSFLPASGERQYNNLLNNIVDLSFYGKNYDLTKPLKYYTDVLGAGSLLFIVSDFIGLKGQEWIRVLKNSSKKLDVIAVMIRDPRDREMPDDYMDVVLESPEGGRKKLVNPAIIKHSYEAYIKMEEARIEQIFRESGAEFLSITTDKDFVPLIATFLRRRIAKFR